MLREIRLDGGRGLQRRLYQALRDAILAGRLAPGSRLPPTRTLAEEFGLSRQTVVLAYERLQSEGYATGRVGAGTFVSASLQPARPETGAAQAAPARTLSAWSARAATALPPPSWQSGLPFDFRPGVPDWEAFPHTRWRRLLARRWRQPAESPALAQYGDPAGYGPLREALTAYLARSRGLRCTSDQLVIVSGSQQALDLLARICLDPGDVAALEDPGYPPARAIYQAAGARLLPLPVDEQGIQVDQLRGHVPCPRVVYVTPSHQYPTGVTLSLPRRLELIDWAAGAGALIIEDDYDSELRYAGPPLPAMQGLDERGCVVYAGSCSSVLFPPLRVGWIVAPPPLVPALVAAKWLADRQTSTLDQQVLADFISAGDFARHLRRSRALYAARRAALAAAVARHLPAECALTGDAAGLQTPLYLPPGADERRIVEAAAARGVGVEGISACYHPGEERPAPACLTDAGEATHRRPGLLLGFAALDEPAIDEGIRRLGQAIRSAAR